MTDEYLLSYFNSTVALICILSMGNNLKRFPENKV